MRLPDRKLLDEALVSDEPCLGAACCSYTFDPAFFEEHVLRGLLRLQGDPDEDPARYLEEARQALRDTPVACLVDATVRRPGHRLPYDLLLVRARVFHPKLVLALYAGHARLLIGSGNITRPGFEHNLELFFARSLDYADAHDAALLRQVDQFLQQAAAQATHAGSQLGLVRAELERRLRHGGAPSPTVAPDVSFASSFGTALLSQLDAALPADAALVRVGVLAPFFEQDDRQAGADADGFGSVLLGLLSLRPARGAMVDLGVAWEDAPVAPSGAPVPLAAPRPALWAWRRPEPAGDTEREVMDYLTLEAIGPRSVTCRDRRGQGRRLERSLLERAAAARQLWPVPPPQVFAPRAIIQRLSQQQDLRLWLHPAAALSDSGRPLRRPLHAKLLLLTFQQGRRTRTLMVAGSANASRAALGRSVEDGGNVEAVVLTLLEGEVGLPEVLPALVRADLEQLELQERQFPVGDPDLSAWILDAVHDARARTLEVTWAAAGPAPLGAWRLSHDGRALAQGPEVPPAPTRIADFDLSRGTAELALSTAAGEWLVPIRVADLRDLPAGPGLTALGLRELLALLGRRIGAERLGGVRAARGPAGAASALDAIFGEGFSPTDVFRVWWSIAADLAGPISVPGFRHRLSGPTSARRVWELLQEEQARQDDGLRLTRDEVWVYGCELRQSLRAVALPDGADRAEKQSLLDELCAALAADLRRLRPEAGGRPWLSVVARFYGLEDSDA